MEKIFSLLLICVIGITALSCCSCESAAEKTVKECKIPLEEGDAEKVAAILHDFRLNNGYSSDNSIQIVAENAITLALDNDNLDCAKMIAKDIVGTCNTYEFENKHRQIIKYMLKHKQYKELEEFEYIITEGTYNSPELIVTDMAKRGNYSSAYSYIKKRYPHVEDSKGEIQYLQEIVAAYQ